MTSCEVGSSGEILFRTPPTIAEVETALQFDKSEAGKRAYDALKNSCVANKSTEHSGALKAPVENLPRVEKQTPAPNESSEHQRIIASISTTLNDLIKGNKVASKEQIASLNRALDSIPKNAQIPVSGEGSLAKRLRHAFWVQKTPQWEVMGGWINTYTLRSLLNQQNGSQVLQGTPLISETLWKKETVLSPEQRKMQAGSIKMIEFVYKTPTPRNDAERQGFNVFRKAIATNLQQLPDDARIKVATYGMAYSAVRNLGVNPSGVVNTDASISAKALADALMKAPNMKAYYLDPRKVEMLRKNYNG